MIIQALCNKCFQPYKITVAPSEQSLVKEVLTDSKLTSCPRNCGGTISLTDTEAVRQMMSGIRLRPSMTLSGTTLYRAIKGAGLPDEIEKDPSVIEALLKANKVESVDIEVWNDKIYIHELHLSNGMILHLTSGIKGAEVLKVTKPWVSESSQKQS